MRKILVLLLCICMTLSAVPVFAEEAADTAATAETTEAAATTEAEEVVISDPTSNMKALIALGVFDEAVLEKADAEVNRMEFAKIAVKFAAIDVITTDGAYLDLTGEDANFAKTAVTLELMDDGVSGKFGFDKSITGADVIKTLVKSFGYAEVAKHLGGYLKASRMLGIATDVNPNAPITYKKLAEVFMKTARKKAVTAYVAGADVNTIEKEQTYLEEKFGASIMTGRMTANSKTSLYSTTGVAKGLVKVGSVIYKTTLDIDAHLGSKIKYITIGEDDVKEIIYVYEDYLKDNDLVLKAEDIYDFSNGTYTYFEGEDKETARVSGDRVVIYNGESLANYTKDIFKPVKGNVRLVSSDGDGEYDVVFINEYRTMVVSGHDTKFMKIYDKNGEETLNYEKAENITVIRSGNKVSIADIKLNNVISVYKSNSGKTLTVNVVQNTVKGTIDGAQPDEKTVTIAGKDYKIETSYFNKYTENSANLLLNKRVEAWVNAEGLLTYLEYTANSTEVGYLITAAQKSNMDKTLQFKIFTANNEFEIFDAASEKIIVDNVMKNADDTITALEKGTGDIYTQVILYTLNDEGKIASIDTAYNNQPLEVDDTPLLKRKPTKAETEDSFRVTYSSYLGTDKSALWCKEANNTLGRNPVHVAAKSGAWTIVAPPNDAAKDADEMFFKMTDFNTYFVGDQSYKVEAYAISGAGIASDIILVFDESAGSVGNVIQQNNVRMITDIKKSINEDGEAVVTMQVAGNNYSSKKIYATKEEHWKYVPADNQSMFPEKYELGKGDIIFYDINAKNEITTIYLIWDASEPVPEKAFVAASRPDMIRLKSDILGYPGMRYLDVYEIDGEWAKCTTTDLTNYTGDGSDLVFWLERIGGYTGSAFKIDKRGSKIVTTTTENGGSGDMWKDIKDFKTAGKERSRIIPVQKWGYHECLFIIEG